MHIVQCSTDTDSRVTCSNNYFLKTARSCKASPLTPIYSHDTSQVHDILMTFHKHALVILCGERRNDYEQRIYTPTKWQSQSFMLKSLCIYYKVAWPLAVRAKTDLMYMISQSSLHNEVQGVIGKPFLPE